MIHGESRQERHQPVLQYRGGRQEGHRGLLRRLGAHLLHGMPDLLQRRLRRFQEPRAGRRRRHAAGAGEKRHAQLLFQQPDMLADRALGQAQRIGRARETAQAGHRNEDLQREQGKWRT
nr:hypothetical protein [Bordetella genomosp. 10]